MRKALFCEVFTSIPTLETDRLILRQIQPRDAFDMYDYSKNPNVTRYLLWSPHPNVQHTKDYIRFLQGEYKKGACYDWAILLKSSGKMIGTCGFVSFDSENASATVGYVLHPDHWGCGIAPEALRRVLSFGFQQLSLHRIEAQFMEENTRSLRVMEKCGMRLEGYKRKAILIKGSFETVGVAAVLQNEFSIR